MSVHNSRVRCLQLQLLKNWSSRIGVGLRSISQARVNCSEEEKKDYNVWQSWVISILKETAEKEKIAAAAAGTKEAFLRRPPTPGPDQQGDRTANTKVRQHQQSRSSSSTESGRARKSKNMFRQAPVDDKMIWVDCEMTGLDPLKDKLMEIGIVVTDGNLNVIAEHDSVVFHIEEPVLAGMGDWCQKHHGDSGLTESARKSTITHEAADELLLKFVQQHTTARECPMAGNSIGQDVGFIRLQLPKLYSHFHYRVIDVSTLKELARRWHPDVLAAAPKKKFSHRVLDDIKDSIAELQHYRSAMIFPSKNNAETATKQVKE